MKLLASIFLLLGSSVLAGEFSHITNYSIGIVNVGVTENESTLKQTDSTVTSGTDQKSSTAKALSVISFNMNYEFNISSKRSYFAKVTVPLMSADGAGLFLGGLGFNLYLNELGTIYRSNMAGVEIVIIPKLRYWWGASAGLGYLVYNTESQKKSDTVFDLAIHGGAGYNFGEKWGLRAEVIVGRGTGIATTGINTRMFAGVTYYL